MCTQWRILPMAAPPNKNISWEKYVSFIFKDYRHYLSCSVFLTCCHLGKLETYFFIYIYYNCMCNFSVQRRFVVCKQHFVHHIVLCILHCGMRMCHVLYKDVILINAYVYSVCSFCIMLCVFIKLVITSDRMCSCKYHFVLSVEHYVI